MAQHSYKPPYMPWYERDYWSSKVRRLTPLARLMFRSLLQQGWHSDNPPYIPADDEQLRIFADAPSRSAWQKNSQAILSLLTKTDDGEWYYHHKAVDLYAAAKSLYEKKRAGGQSAGRNRSLNGVHRDSIRTVAGLRQDTYSSPIAKDEDTLLNQNHDHDDHGQNQGENYNKPPISGSTVTDLVITEAKSQPRSNQATVDYMALWNANCGLLPKVKELTGKRAARLKLLCRNPTFAQDFVEGIRTAANTPFLRGENDRGWKADFDWFIKNDTNLTRVVEGTYGRPGKRTGNGISADRSLDKYTTGLPRTVVACSEEEESS